MDFEDDPDITPWHLSQRMIMLVKLAEEKKKEGLSPHVAKHLDDPDKLMYTCKNVVLRLFIACAFLALCVGLLAFSIEQESGDETTTVSPGTVSTIFPLRRSSPKFYIQSRFTEILSKKENVSINHVD